MHDKSVTLTSDPSPKNVVTLSSETVVPCPGCGQLFVPRRPNQKYCTPKCRLLAFQAKRQTYQRERDAKARLLLRTARESIDEAVQLLTPDDEETER